MKGRCGRMLYGYIDRGKEVIPCQFEWLRFRFANTWVGRQDGEYTLLIG
ncbi:MAG: WG repeat-containing protein [Alistipes finegoldii]